MQLDLLDYLSEYRGITKSKIKNHQLKNNYIKYGYFFVGKSWIPHATIASIKFKDNKKVTKFKKNFFENKETFKFDLKSISFWNISSNKHKKLFTIKLNEKS